MTSNRLPDRLTEDGGIGEHWDIRLMLDIIATDPARTDAERRIAWRALQEIRRLAEGRATV